MLIDGKRYPSRAPKFRKFPNSRPAALNGYAAAVSSTRTHKARALLVTDPSADRWLLDFARQIVGYGGTGVERQQDTELMPEAIGTEQVDLVVVVRSERGPSREVLRAALLAREHGKPVHALVASGVQLGLEVDEVHVVDGGPSWESLQELHDWASSLSKRFGKPM